MRSAMAPEAMVTAVAANTTWKKKNDGVASTSPSPAKDSDMPDRKNPSLPMRLPLLEPKANPKPTAQKARAPIAMSARFLAMMLPMFLARVMPASTRANPACIRNTRQPATMSHRLASRAVFISAGVSSWAAAGAAVIRMAPTTPNRPKPNLRPLLLVRRASQLRDRPLDRERASVRIQVTMTSFGLLVDLHRRTYGDPVTPPFGQRDALWSVS